MANYFVRMPDPTSAAQVMGLMGPLEPGRRARRVGAGPTAPRQSRTVPTLLVGALDPTEARALERGGAQVYEDIEFEPFPGPSAKEFWRSAPDAAALTAGLSLNDVLHHIRAPDAWTRGARGAGVTVAVIDTGTCSTLREFPAAKRSPVDLQTTFAGQHWQDVRGHGSMCATIAAGTRVDGGRFDGVAPDATVLSARTTLMATDIFEIYDDLISLKRAGIGPLVITNSYGLYRCQPSGVPQDHPYLEIILTAIGEGTTVVFAAGNNHHDVACNHDPTACSPNTIWAVNSHDQVICVGTVNADNSNRDPATPHVNSSRGPGEWAVSLPKPDCVAPTYGEVVWGCGYQVMDWWGTSGACPQVAGLAALMLSVNPLLNPAQIADIIRSTCRDIGAPTTCVGSGLIDCASAVETAAAVA